MTRYEFREILRKFGNDNMALVYGRTHGIERDILLGDWLVQCVEIYEGHPEKGELEKSVVGPAKSYVIPGEETVVEMI